MSIHAWMLTGLLLAAAPTAPADSPPMPKLVKGLEITWKGTFSEAILRPNVRAFRAYEVETRIFVLDVSPNGSDIALFTKIKLKPDIKTLPEPSPVVRLELGRVDPNGKLWLLGADMLSQSPEKRKPFSLPLMPMEGLPTFEPSLFVAFPAEKFRQDLSWNVPEDKRPAMAYRVAGVDSVHGSRCIRLIAAQTTDEWDQPRSDRPAWRRGEILLVSAKHGYTARLERTIEKRDPQSGELAFRSKLVCEQVGYLKYPERFGDDRREEIVNAAYFQAAFEQLLPEAGKSGPKPFDQLLRRIEQHVSTHVPGEAIPYRQAIVFVKQKVEAAKRGNIPPAPLPPETTIVSGLTIGKPAPDATALDLTNGESIPLNRLRGRPAVLVYYQPNSEKTAEPVLRFAQNLHSRFNEKAFVLPLAIGQSDMALRQRNELKLAVHVLAGRDASKRHEIESAPCFVVLDADGQVKKVILGWSDANVLEVRSELEKWLK